MMLNVYLLNEWIYSYLSISFYLANLLMSYSFLYLTFSNAVSPPGKFKSDVFSDLPPSTFTSVEILIAYII